METMRILSHFHQVRMTDLGSRPGQERLLYLGLEEEVTLGISAYDGLF